ncbi:MAG TPA: DUF6113 family protein [Streptosporangiaceae bacterium]|jgi:hypothetical protein|nr:DUF6113 family protein [Streptosporangiaceae bacterium]
MNVTTGKPGRQAFVTGGVYGVLFLLGAVEGAIGSFQYSRMAGPVPLAALAFCAVLLLTCLLAGWAMRAVSGALVPAIGWIVASFVLSMPVSNGSVIITASAPGEWYLYGGTISAVIAVAASFGRWIRATGAPPQSGAPPKTGASPRTGAPPQ